MTPCRGKVVAVDTPWYHHPLRIAALQCNYEPDNLAVLDRWHDSGFNTEQLLHLIGQDYYGLFDEQRHGTTLARYLDKAHALGMRIIVYMNTHLIPQPLADRDPEWAARTPDGQYRTAYETYRLACPNSPWADWVLDGLEKLAHYDIDGVFSDGPSGACACAHCARLYPQGTLPASPAAGSSEALALQQFDLETRVRFCRRFYERLKSVRAQAICYQNLDVLHLPCEPFLPYNDLVGSEGAFMFYGPPGQAYLWKTSLRAKALEACSHGKPTVIFAAGDQKPWSWYLHAPGETRIMYAASVANGASVWYGLHCPSRSMDLPGGRAAAGMNRFLAEHESLYHDTESLARTAVLHSPSTRAHYRTASEASDFYAASGSAAAQGPGDVGRSLEGCAAMLYQSQVPFDLLSEEAAGTDGLGRYTCVVLPTCACLPDAAVQGLRAFVRRGGLLVATLDSSLFDGDGRRREDFGLADVFGASIREGVDRFRNFNYFEIADRAHPLVEDLAVSLIAAPEYGLRVEATTAQVVARYRAPLAGRYEPMTPLAGPAVLWNRFGEGHCLYLAGTFGEFYLEYAVLEYRQLLYGAIRRWAPPPVQMPGAPPSLEVAFRRKRDDSAALIHLINYTGSMVRPIQQALPLQQVRLAMRPDALSWQPARAQALVSGSTLGIARTGDGIELELPEIAGEYEVVLLLP